MKPWLVSLALCSCGAVGTAGAPESNLPQAGIGPFVPIKAMAGDRIDAPTVLSSLGVDYDDPIVVVSDGKLHLWATARRGDSVSIQHAESSKLGDGFSLPEAALTADAEWEQGKVESPAVVAGSPWLLFYAAGGAIGIATSADRFHFQKRATPVLTANGAEEGGALSAPSAVRDGDRVRLYYVASGVVWAADGSVSDWLSGSNIRRLDGGLATPDRDPMLARAPYAVAIGRAFAQVTATPIGRQRHDLFFSATLSAASETSDAVTNCGVAASFSGSDFVVASTPILPTRPSSRAPAMVVLDRPLLFYVIELSGHGAIAAATMP